jgi:hypothetical protein
VGCGSATGPDNREDQFDQLWETFDRTYPYFTYKQIDWEAARASYRDAAIRAGSMEAFSLVIGQMLAPLRDAHVYLETRGGIRTPTYVPHAPVNWNPPSGGNTSRERLGPARRLGWGKWGDVGYIAISIWSVEQFTAATSIALSTNCAIRANSSSTCA